MQVAQLVVVANRRFRSIQKIFSFVPVIDYEYVMRTQKKKAIIYVDTIVHFALVS